MSSCTNTVLRDSQRSTAVELDVPIPNDSTKKQRHPGLGKEPQTVKASVVPMVSLQLWSATHKYSNIPGTTHTHTTHHLLKDSGREGYYMGNRLPCCYDKGLGVTLRLF